MYKFHQHAIRLAQGFAIPWDQQMAVRMPTAFLSYDLETLSSANAQWEGLAHELPINVVA